MEIKTKLLKPITEAKYLTTENCGRYRPILRFFFEQYEKIKYWMYKEEIFAELKKHPSFAAYTLEQCQQDLEVLVEWGNLLPVQDTSRAATVEQFKNKQFRYQLSEYSVEIERLTIKLENLFIEGASLEPTLFERIKDEVLQIKKVVEADLSTVGTWWRDLNTDFKRLNQNYQDYIRSFHSLKAEERMKTQEFIIYKDALISYLREFVKGLQKNAHLIEEALRKIPDETIEVLLQKVLEQEKAIPRLDMEVAEQEIAVNIQGRWQNFRDWFLGGANQESEVARILEITNEIIRKITRYAAQIAESRHSAANRKEEYRRLCSLFLQCSDQEEAHKLSSLVFGLFNTRHIRGDLERQTESINSSVYAEAPFHVQIKPRIRAYREKALRSGIKDKTKQKQELLAQYLRKLEQEKTVIDSYMQGNILDVAALPVIEPFVRTTILKWIGKACSSPEKTAKTEDGRVFSLLFPPDKQRCSLRCEDGELEMPAFRLSFKT